MRTQLPHAADLATSAGVGQVLQKHTAGVGQVSQDLPMCEFAREMAIGRASELADYFHAERQCFEALYARTGCFSHKGAADRAHINELKAREIHQSLIRSRGEK